MGSQQSLAVSGAPPHAKPALRIEPPLASRREDAPLPDWLAELGGRQFVIPAGASFYMGDIRRGLTTIEDELVPRGGFRLAIVDPPWPSKSRGKKVPAPPHPPALRAPARAGRDT